MQTSQAIDFYFDFSSPYGYFMAEKITLLAEQHGRTVTWRPILLFALLRAQGLPPPFEHPVKLDYIVADFERTARFLDIDYHLPKSFPVLTQHAARAFYLLNQIAPTRAVAFAHAVMHSYWREARDISDIDLIAQMVCDASDRLGQVEAVREQLRSDTAKTLLQDAIAEAVGNKVFGSPFVIIDGEPFFGVDRLPQIAARLARRSKI